VPKGPQGQKRKADVIGKAVLVMKIATGEEQETKGKPARARLTETLWDIGDIVKLIEEREAA
jgi:hypothetical protein